jgi:hypothetical protein
MLDGGAEGDRTPDLRNAIATLSQLSYGPILHVPLSDTSLSRKEEMSRVEDLAFVVLSGRFNSEVLVTSFEVDLFVSTDLFVLVDREIVGSEFLVLGSFFLHLWRRLEGKGLLRLEDRLGYPVGSAIDAVDRLVFAKIIKACRALGASALGAPFGLHHLGLNSSKKCKSRHWGKQFGGAPCHRDMPLSKRLA